MLPQKVLLARDRVGELKFCFEKFALGLNLKVREDLKILRLRTFYEINKGHTLLSKFSGYSKFLAALYPFFHSTSLQTNKTFWNTGTNRKYYLEKIPQECNMTFLNQNDWVMVDTDFMKKHHGAVLLNQFSVLDLLGDCFPEFFWDRMGKFPSQEGYERRRKFMDEVVVRGLQFVVTQKELVLIDWKTLESQPRASAILSAYDNSFNRIFKDNYPELSPQFSNVQGYWKSRVAIDRFLLDFGFVETKDHFKEITTNLLSHYPGGLSLLSLNKGSIVAILEVYRELKIFSKSCLASWEPKKKHFLIPKLMKMYDIKQKKDWYRVSIEQFSLVSGKHTRPKEIIILLKDWFKEEDWNCKRFTETNKRARQRYLGLKLTQIFQNEVIFEDYVFYGPDKIFIFDFYLPGMNLVLEYQGELHYHNIFKWSHLEYQKQRDQEKKELCQLLKLNLVEIPFWWTGSTTQLKQYIDNTIPLNSLIYNAS